VLGTLSEVGGGLLLALGLFAPLGAVAIAVAMLVAVGVHCAKGPMARNGGYELAIRYGRWTWSPVTRMIQSDALPMPRRVSSDQDSSMRGRRPWPKSP